MLSAYALTYGGLLLLGGRAADLLGRRRLFMAGVLLFTAASLMCGLAWSPAALLIARVVQGVGAAIMTPSALSIISTTFPSALEDPKWTNVTVLKGDVVDEVSKLKHELDGEIVVYASYQLGRTLLEHDLVDEVRLVIYPVVLGDGERLFGATSDKKPMRLLNTQTIGDGLAFLTYEMVREP